MRQGTLRGRLTVMSLVLIVPFIVITGILVYQLNRVTALYDSIVQNITRANTYNIVFKEDMDAVMYQMVARSLSEEEVASALGMESPETLIVNAADTFRHLESSTSSPEAKRRIESILKLLDTLSERAEEINETVEISGHYDENMMRLDTDIRIITELIQERISEYIYYESVSLDEARREADERRKVVTQAAIITVVAATVLASVLAVLLIRSTTKPIDRLVYVTEQVAQGNFEVRVGVEKEEELSRLSGSLNSMIERIGELVENIRREQVNSRNLELRLLQAQINPHFLYNTLDNILWLSEDGRKEDVAAIVTALSRFFRTTLSGGREFIPLSEEISHIEAYLEIQQFRYRDILRYRIDVPEELGSFGIIKMTLQPIVENALYHGIKNKRGMGMIRVKALEQENRLVISVEDDGIGMKEEELIALMRMIDGIQKPEPDNTGFGMSNVAERLRLNYGESSGIAVKSRYGEGTKVEIFIPKHVIIE